MKSKLSFTLAVTSAIVLILSGCANSTSDSSDTPDTSTAAAASAPSATSTAADGTTGVATGTQDVDVKAPEEDSGINNSPSNTGTSNAAKMIAPVVP